MVDATRSSARLALHTVFLVGGNVLLAWVIASVLLGPVAALFAAGVVCVLALSSPPLRARTALVNGARELAADHWVSRVVATLGVRAELKDIPKAYLLPGNVANAMAIGDSNDGAVAITQGALDYLDDDELAGVLAHEVSHLAHGDTRLMALAGTAGRLTGFMSQIAIIMVIFSIPLMLMGQVTIHPLVFLLILLAPSLAILMQMALSRAREFAADRRAAALVGSAQGLARALSRIDAAGRRMVPPWLAPYMGGGHPWLRSHPATPERVQVLSAIPDDPSVPPLPPRGGMVHKARRGLTSVLMRIFRGW